MTKRSFLTGLVLVVAIVGGMTFGTSAQEGTGTAALGKAPKALQDSVKKLVGANKMTGFGVERTLGLTINVVEVATKSGTEYAFGLDNEGKIVVRWVALDQSIMPSEVTMAAKKAHPAGKIGETTICLFRGKLSYSMENKVGNDTYQMMLDPDGKVTYDEIKRGGAEK